VNPIVHHDWQGEDIALPDDPAIVLRPAEIPALRDQVGNDIVTASAPRSSARTTRPAWPRS